MTENKREIERILVALDASTGSLSALRAAVRLAADADAELVGLFVEDINLLRLADHPVAREVRLVSAAETRPRSSDVQLSLRAQAARARRALDRAAAEEEVTATFRVVRGPVSLSLIAEAVDADLIMLGRVSRPLTRRRRLGSTARAIIAQMPRSVLLAQTRVDPEQTIALTFDNSPLAWRALRQAYALAEPESRILILLATADPDEAAVWQRETGRWLRDRGRVGEYRQLPRVNVTLLTHLVAEETCELLMLTGERLDLTREALAQLVDEVDCSVMVVRS